jgi:preprotein translocase subunit SecF
MNNLIFLGKRKVWWLSFSALILIFGISAVLIWKLPLGIDYKGGSILDVTFAKPVDQTQLEQKVDTYSGGGGAVVSKNQDGSYQIKTLPITQSQHTAIISNLSKDFSTVTEKQYQLVGPSVSKDLTEKAFLAIGLAAVLIILYLAYAFRTVSQPVSSWRFGLVAVIALLHDLLITVGVFSIVAHFFNYEIDSTFITALLTVMGFSVHDTIVVFDRLRENLLHNKVEEASSFEKLADQSLRETLNRSLATSLTVIFTLTALTILGGESIRPFIVTLLIGITIGTYSSIFTATPLLVIWQNNVFNKNAKKS